MYLDLETSTKTMLIELVTNRLKSERKTVLNGVGAGGMLY